MFNTNKTNQSHQQIDENLSSWLNYWNHLCRAKIEVVPGQSPVRHLIVQFYGRKSGWIKIVPYFVGANQLKQFSNTVVFHIILRNQFRLKMIQVAIKLWGWQIWILSVMRSSELEVEWFARNSRIDCGILLDFFQGILLNLLYIRF